MKVLYYQTAGQEASVSDSEVQQGCMVYICLQAYPELIVRAFRNPVAKAPFDCT